MVKLVPKLDEFCRPWGPRALGELYRINEPVQLDDLVDRLITDYHGPDVEEMLTAMIGSAVRASLLAGTEAGAVAVTVPAGTGTEVDQWVRRSSAMSGEPAWAVFLFRALRSNSPRSAATWCGRTCWRREATRLSLNRSRDPAGSGSIA